MHYINQGEKMAGREANVKEQGGNVIKFYNIVNESNGRRPRV
jgi:hypothetical protein